MKKLIADLEAATEGSFALNHRIALELDLPMVRAFSQNIDAALTLVPEGWVWGRDATQFMFLQEVTWPVEAKGPKFIGSDAATPALALCIAALKVRDES